MNLNNFKITNKSLYWGLIITFSLLYLFVGFVSTLHSITFFRLANTISLSILLGITYELGQAAVLFSVLLTKNKDKFLPWALMILLTALQVTANVYASFKHMIESNSTDWVYWQKSILVGVQASTPEMYQVIISWISGALLPIVALGMTALVANNLKYLNENDSQIEDNKETQESNLNILNESPKKTNTVNTTSIENIIQPSKGEEALKRILSENSTPVIENPLPNKKMDSSESDESPYMNNGIEVLDPKK